MNNENENENEFPLISFMRIAESVSAVKIINEDLKNAISTLAKSLDDLDNALTKNITDIVVLNALTEKYFYNKLLLEQLKLKAKLL